MLGWKGRCGSWLQVVRVENKDRNLLTRSQVLSLPPQSRPRSHTAQGPDSVRSSTLWGHRSMFRWDHSPMTPSLLCKNAPLAPMTIQLGWEKACHLAGCPVLLHLLVRGNVTLKSKQAPESIWRFMSLPLNSSPEFKEFLSLWNGKYPNHGPLWQGKKGRKENFSGVTTDFFYFFPFRL